MQPAAGVLLGEGLLPWHDRVAAEDEYAEDDRRMSAVSNIKTFSKLINGREYFFAVTAERAELGYILLPEVCPTLVKKYQGVQLQQEEGITIAAFAPQEKTYKVWSGGEWIPTVSPEFMSVETLNQGLSQWYGSLQLKLQLDDLAQLQYIDLGYEVGVELEYWLLKFGLIDFFSLQVSFTTTTYCNDGTNILPPPNVDIGKMHNIRVQPKNEPQVGGVVVERCDRLETEKPIAPGGVALYYDLIPKVEFVYGEHLIDELPCVTITSLGETNRRDLLWSCPINQYTNRLTYYYDLLLELKFIANNPFDAKNLAHAVYSKVKHSAKIYCDPFDLNLAIAVSGDIRDNQISEIEGSLPSYSLTVKVVNLFGCD